MYLYLIYYPGEELFHQYILYLRINNYLVILQCEWFCLQFVRRVLIANRQRSPEPLVEVSYVPIHYKSNELTYNTSCLRIVIYLTLHE